METINIGFKKFEVSEQAKLVYNAFLIIFICHLLSGFVTDMGPVAFILYSIYLLGVGSLSVYASNCIVVGQCITYAWIVSYLYIIIAVMYVVALAFVLWVKFASGNNMTRKSVRKSRK